MIIKVMEITVRMTRKIYLQVTFFRDNVQKQMCHDCIYKDQNVEHLNKKNYVLFLIILKGNLCVSC